MAEITPERARTIYENRFDDAAQRAKSRIWRVVVEDFLQHWVAPGDTVLDLGCGFGEFLNHIRCGQKIGVDMNADVASRLEPGTQFHAGSVCDLAFLENESVDLVFTSNLMEHLPTKADVERMIDEARRVLRPGGHFVALGPNLRCVPGPYWDFWDHFIPITDRSLVEVLEIHGFEAVDAFARFLPFTTRSRLPQWPVLVRLYLRCPPVWRLLGGQFLIRARRLP